MAYKNVREPYAIYDSICVCKTLFGSEESAGFFRTFQDFADNERHRLFKIRNEGNVHTCYNNQKQSDRADFVFRLFSIGVHFFAPPTPLDIYFNPSGPTFNVQEGLPPFWTMELPRHVNLSLKIGQDEKVNMQAMQASPGYGPAFNGAGTGNSGWVGEGTTEPPALVWAATQGTPHRRNRFFTATGPDDKPIPISIPRGEILEATLTVSEIARDLLSNAGGPYDYWFWYTGGELDPETQSFPTRYGVVTSLYGYREVQQRGRLHR